jgi:hypothetical protein
MAPPQVFETPAGATIEVVRGRVDDARAEQLLRFWQSEGALGEPAARERLPEVVCVLLDDAGEVIGANSAYAAAVEPLGRRTFWVYRSFLAPDAAGAAADMLQTAILALEAEFDPGADGPIGVCAPIEPAEAARRPEVHWLYPRMFYAGHLPDGRQLRVRYFLGARVGSPRPVVDFGLALDPRYRIDLFADQRAIDADAVIDLWVRDGALPPEEANRRVHEVLLVATDGGREPCAVATTYLQRNTQLGLDLWHFRVFVAPAHRNSHIAWAAAMVARDHLESRYVANQDTRGAGIVYEVENAFLKQWFDEAVWIPVDFAFIGENARGDHVRLHYFPGARVPAPAGE